MNDELRDLLVDLASDSEVSRERSATRFERLAADGLGTLVKGLDDPDLGSVGHARILGLLETIGDDSVLPAVRRRLRKAIEGGDPIVTPAALATLTTLGGGRAVRELSSLLDSADGDIARDAAILLGFTGAPTAISPLRELLGSDDPGLRYVAVGALRRLGGPEARAALAAHAADETDPEVRALLSSALRDGPD